MSWTELLTREIEQTYGATAKLMDQVDESRLAWKPATGQNWLTMGQLLWHITSACGKICHGFATGDWGMPEGADPSQMKPEDMLPPAEKFPSIGSVAEAKKLLAEDRRLAMTTIETVGEERLRTQRAPAPWDPSDMVLGHRMLQMVDHLKQHRGQLFYYLKLQGKPVNTTHLWGM